MSERNNLLDGRYQALYADYYSGAKESPVKRQISAGQSVAALGSIVGKSKLGRLLDVGAGDGSVLQELSRLQVAEELYAVEISPSGIDAIKARQLPDLQEAALFDGYHLPFPDKHFDLAIALHVLEHVEHERLLLREMRRVARRLYVEVPLEHGLNVRRAISQGKPYGHINFYTPHTLRGLLESCGLRLTGCRVAPSSLAYEQHVSGRFKGGVKHAVRRAALAVSPALAPWFMTYNGFAYCECE
jgi:SAM-dependent methyltransferase